MQGDLKALVAEVSYEEQIDKHTANLGIAIGDFGHGPGDLLPPLQLVQAFSNRFMVTCSQVIQILQAFGVPDDESTHETVQTVGDSSGSLQVSSKEDEGGPIQQELQRLWNVLKKHRSTQAQRERVGLVQVLFAHIVNLKLFSCVMQVCLAACQYIFGICCTLE
jgi:hypothetical protein